MSMKEVDKNLVDVPDDANRPQAARLTDGSTFYKATTPTDTQPISAVALPLPTGAATEASLATLSGTVSAGRVQVDAVVSTGDIEIGAVEIKDGATDTRVKVKTDGTDNALVVMQNSQPLPTGAATEATLASIDGNITACDTGNVTIASSALPTGAATAAAQTDKSQFTKITDGTDTALVTASGELNVIATAQPGVDIGDVTVNNGAGAAAVNIQDGGNSITIDAASLPLPTGAATEATLASIDSKITACNTGAVTVASSALPTGAATEATLAGIDTTLTDASQKTQIVDGAGNVVGATSNALDVNIASSAIAISTTFGVTNPNLGISAFDLSGANSNQASVELNSYVSGSIQLVWTGATSSDAFVTPGVITVEVSNNNSNWESLISYEISSASGQVMSRGIAVDFRYMRTTWLLNASTAGTANITSAFKAA